MSIRRVLITSSLLAIAVISSTVSASAQSNDNQPQRVLRGSGASPLASPPNNSGLTSTSTMQSDRDMQAEIMKDCGVAAWQVSVTTEAGGQLRVQMSPTLAPVVKKCIMADATAPQ